MLVDFEKLPDTSKIWIYQSSRKFYPEEIAEKIETLRWIQNLDTVKGVRIEDYNNIEINTPEDTVHWERNHNQYDWSEW